MKSIKNNGNKIVHIGTKALMPGESVNVSDKAADVPAVKALAKQNVLTVSDATETASAASTKSSAAANTTAANNTATSAETSATADTTKSEKTATKKSTATASK